MKIEKARELLQRIKVAKIQLNNLKKVGCNSSITFRYGSENRNEVFYFDEQLEEGNGKLVEHIANAAIEYMEQRVKKLEQYLEDLSDDQI